MEKRHCPYLGIIDDPTSHAGFPDGSNACHRAKKPVKVALDYQQTHCLCDAYQECPGYTRGWENGFPLELRADYDPTSKNIIKKIQFWKEEQQQKLSQKQEKPDWKELLRSKFQLRKEKSSEKQKEIVPEKTTPVKIVSKEEPISKKEEIVEETKLDSAIDLEEKARNKNILHNEADLKEYLREKRRSKNPLRAILSKKTKSDQEASEKSTKEKNPLPKEQKTKKDWKAALLAILPWKKQPQQRLESRQTLQDEQVQNQEQKPKPVWRESSQPQRVPQQAEKLDVDTKKDRKKRRSLKEVLQNILPWKKQRQIPPDRIKAIQDELSIEQEEQVIKSDAESLEAEQPVEEEQIVETSTQANQVKEPLIEEEKLEILPNEWVKEEEQFEETEKEAPQEELPQWESEIISEKLSETQPQQVVADNEEYLPDIMSWRDKQKSKPEKKGLLKRKQHRKKEKPTKDRSRKTPEGVMAWRDKHREKSGWKDAFKNKRVWLVSFGIILIFLLVIFIPQLPGLNLNLMDRFEGFFNPPVSKTTAAAYETPVSTPEGITQTEAITSGTTEVPTNTPLGQPTPTITATPTITPTTVPTLTPTPGPPSLIPITRTP